MRTPKKVQHFSKVFHIAGLATGLLLVLLPVMTFALEKSQQLHTYSTASPDTVNLTPIQVRLAEKNHDNLFFPGSVTRFYKLNNFQPVWFVDRQAPKETSEALRLLGCGMEFGLWRADYHPNQLSPDSLHNVLLNTVSVSKNDKARLDILLTDALITFINNLHYGKLNPLYSDSKIDAGIPGGFAAENVLEAAIQQKNLNNVITAVQPKNRDYTGLQNLLHFFIEVYKGDCDQIPVAGIRKIAINMERLRWAALDENKYIHINIPSFSLKFHQPDTTFEFKVVVGKPATPSPTLNSAITYFTTAPEWRVPKKIMVKEMVPRALKNSAFLTNKNYLFYDNAGHYVEHSRWQLMEIRRHPDNYYMVQSPGCDNSLGLIVFRFPNIYDVYLHDTPEKQFFKRDVRAFSHGCIRVENAEDLAALILRTDMQENRIDEMHGAIKASKRNDFVLKNPLSIKVTYLTCLIKDGILVSYPDIYDQDKSLELALYDIADPANLN